MICTTVLDLYTFRDSQEAYHVCEMVVEEAERQSVDPALSVALSFHESGLRRYVVSKAGAVGPLQVLPRYWPKNCGIDERGQVKAGVTILKYNLRRTRGDEVTAVAMYNAGNNPGERAFRWSRSVLQLTKKLRGEQ